MRNIALWVAIAAVLVLGYSYRTELSGMLTRVETEFLPGSAVATAPHEMTLTESDDGNYYVYGEVNGTQVKFLIDTGASDIVLSPEDARRIGIDMTSLDFGHKFETANGVVEGA